MKPDTQLCVEYVTFKLKHGVDTERFLACSRELDVKFLATEDGFISRKLLLLHDGETWADLAFWRDAAAAKAAEAKFMTEPVSQAYGAFVDMATIRMEHSDEVSGFQVESGG